MSTLSKISTLKSLRFAFCVALIFSYSFSHAQVCSDPVNTIYGLTNGGFIHAIDVPTGTVSPAINPAYPGNAPDQSNGLGYNPLNGKFYYFNRIPSSTIIEFVSFDPATNMYELLSSPATTSSVYSGSITNDGDGYYMWDTQGRLFYYKISTNTWTSITASLVDQYGKDVDSIIRAHASGDGAIDGNGNLWILPSSNSMFGLFRLNGPLPTTPVASLTVTQLVAMTAPPAKFVGISFTITGEIFMITSTDKVYRLENTLSLTLMSTMTAAMGDLTSCNFPMGVLAKEEVQLRALLLSDATVKLSWNSLQGATSYTVERSNDTRNWKAIDVSVSALSIIDASPLQERNYYRIKITKNNSSFYSSVRFVDIVTSQRVALWPNPVRTDLFIQQSSKKAIVTIFSEAGYKLKSQNIADGISTINLKSFPAGKYFVVVRPDKGGKCTYKLIKQ